MVDTPPPDAPIGVWDFVPGGLPTTTVPLNGSRPGLSVDSRYTSPPAAVGAARKTNGHATTLTPPRSSTTTVATSADRPVDHRVRMSGTIGIGTVGSSSERTPRPLAAAPTVPE